MPKSKRTKVITLTKTVSKGREGKSKLVEKIREYLDEYESVYIFAVDNMRTKIFQDLRSKFSENSKFYMGKKSLCRIAFGKTEEDSYLKNLYKFGQKFDQISPEESEVGLFFTNEKPEKVETEIESISEEEFARGGFEATETIEKEAGVLEGLPTSMFKQLIKLKLPVKIVKGTIELETDHVVCSEGDVLTPEQAEVLKLFGIKMAKFRVRLLYRYNKGKITEIKQKDLMEE